MTPKQRVKKKFPQSYLWSWQGKSFFGVEIDKPSPETLGCGETAAKAWAEAANNIRNRSSTTATSK